MDDDTEDDEYAPEDQEADGIEPGDSNEEAEEAEEEEGPESFKTCFLKALPVMVVATSVFVFIVVPFFNGKMYASFDFAAFDIPDRIFYSICLDRGELGLWNPFLWRGFDHAGFGETGMFHPLRWASYRSLPVFWALSTEMILHFPACLIGTFLLLRRSYGYSGSVAVFGATFLAFSVFPLAHFGQMHVNWIVAHLPWMLYAMESCLTGKKPWLGAIWFGLLLASMLLLCHPQTAFLVCVFIAVIMLYRIFTVPFKQFISRIGMLLLGILAGLLIGMLQLVPSLSALDNSVRGKLTSDERGNFSLHPIHLLVNASPGFFKSGLLGEERSNRPGDFVRQPNFDPVYLSYSDNPSEYSSYFGIGLLSLIFAGLVLYREEFLARKNLPAILIFGGATIIALLLMLGRYTPVYQLLENIPYISQFRSPNRYKLLIAAFICLFAARVLFVSQDDNSKRKISRIKIILLLIPFIISAGLSIAAVQMGKVDFQGKTIDLAKTLDFSDQAIWLPATVDLIWGPLIAGLVPLLLFFHAMRKRFMLSSIAVLCLMDICLFGLPIATEVNYRDRNDVKIAKKSMADNDHSFRLISNVNDPLWKGHYLATGYIGMKPIKHIDLANPDHLRLVSIKSGYLGKDKKMMSLPEPHLPRFRLVPNLVESETPFPKSMADPRETAYTVTEKSQTFESPPLEPEEELKIIYDGFDVIRLDVKTKHRRLLVNSDRWTKDWKVEVDGEASQLLPLYGKTMRGIIIKPGNHQVVLYYQPRSLETGRILAFVGFGIIIMMIIVAGVNVRASDP